MALAGWLLMAAGSWPSARAKGTAHAKSVIKNAVNVLLRVIL